MWMPSKPWPTSCAAAGRVAVALAGPASPTSARGCSCRRRRRPGPCAARVVEDLLRVRRVRETSRTRKPFVGALVGVLALERQVGVDAPEPVPGGRHDARRVADRVRSATLNVVASPIGSPTALVSARIGPHGHSSSRRRRTRDRARCSATAARRPSAAGVERQGLAAATPRRPGARMRQRRGWCDGADRVLRRRSPSRRGPLEAHNPSLSSPPHGRVRLILALCLVLSASDGRVESCQRADAILRRVTRSDRASVPDDHVIVLFGALGDLVHAQAPPGPLPPRPRRADARALQVIGTSRKGGSAEDFRRVARTALGDAAGETWERFAQRLAFSAFSAEDPDPLTSRARAEKELGSEPRRLYHLSIPPPPSARRSRHSEPPA